MITVQIQPEYKMGEEYLALSENMGCFFEVLELAFPNYGKDLPDWYKKSGRARSLHGAFIDINVASNEPEIARVSKARCEESCEIARYVGAENVVFHSSCYPLLRGGYLVEWAKRCAEFYTYLSGKHGLSVFIENSFDLDPSPLCELMKNVNGADVSVCLDIGHVALSRAPLADWTGALGENIKYMHLSDNNGLFDDHNPLGSGVADVYGASDFYLSHLDIPLTLEVGGMNGIKASMEFIEKNKLFGVR